MAQAASRMEARTEASTSTTRIDGNNWAASEQHTQMEAFRKTLKDQNALDKSYSAVSANSQRKLDDLSKSVNRSLDCLTDLELVDAKALAHKVNEERAAHHGQSDTMDALRKQMQAPHSGDSHINGLYNAVVLGAAAESHGHVTENKYIPRNGGNTRSNDNDHPELHSREDVAKYYALHPVKKGMPAPID